MDHSATFARHFARLVSLLMHEFGNVDEQKMSLRALVTVNKNGSIVLVAQDWQVFCNDQPVPGALTGVLDVASQMAAHSLLKLEIAAGSSPADLLGIARIVASDASPGDGGAQVTQKLAALGAKTLKFTTVAPVVAAVSAEGPALPVPINDGGTSGAASDAAPSLSQLTPEMSRVSPEELLASLDSAKTSDACTKALDDLVLVAEHSLRIGKTASVGDILHGIVIRDAKLADGELKRAYVLTIRRMSKPALLRAVASLIPKMPARKQYCYEVLERTGEDGADALIELITQAPTADDRKTLFEVLRELRDAVPALTRMLGDSRWFVVRNAADLLGEMVATDAEGALVALLRHSDDRVRRSATNALLRLGTPAAIKGIYDAVSDSSPEVRMQATAAIATRKDRRTSTTLIRAIEEEQDEGVQVAMITALGKVGTPDAVQKLIKMAQSEGRLFRKKTKSFRVAAVQALGEAKTPAALAALRELATGKDKDVRDTATRVLHARVPTSQ
ncbi:MAG TPA: HEAT repeat domain-containing protein [Gemmatimonadaceae bacterium]|jgi:HEAT repeat protein